MNMSFIKTNFIRRSGFRDAKLIVIATEGEKTEPTYFRDLQLQYRNPRIHVEILKRKTSSSSPAHVLKQLKTFKSKKKLNLYDELWMIIDFDKWPVQNLENVAAQCIQSRFLLAVSNPCFEIWLLLHLREITNNNHLRLDNSDKIEREIRNILGFYNKNNLDTSNFLPHLDEAINRAKALDITPSSRWPNDLGTHVYKVAEKIIA